MSREYQIPGRKGCITISHDIFGEVKGFQERVGKVNKILEGLCPDPEAVPVVTQVIARDLAKIWEARPLPRAKGLLEKVKKLRNSAQYLLNKRDKLELSGISSEMLYAIAALADAEIYEKRAEPKSGRFLNKGAQRLAEAFVYHYVSLTGKEPGVSEGHDFVWHLGELFEALNFTAKPQHYAKEAVKAFRAHRRTVHE